MTAQAHEELMIDNTGRTHDRNALATRNLPGRMNRFEGMSGRALHARFDLPTNRQSSIPIRKSQIANRASRLPLAPPSPRVL
jgi:hypothetical protein